MGGFNTSVAQPSPVALELKPPQSQSPLDIAAQMQEGRLRQQQLQGVQMENQQRQMDLQDQQTMRTMLPQLLGDPQFKGADGNPDWQKVTQALAPHVSPKTAFGLQQTILGNQEKVANIAKARSETSVNQNKVEEAEKDYLGNVGLQIQKGGYNPAVVEAWLSHAETLHPSYKPHIDQLRGLIAQDPNSLKTIVDGLVAGSAAATKEGREQQTADITNAKNQQETATSRRALAIQELTGIADAQGNVRDQSALAQWQQKYKDIAPPSRDPQAIAQFLRSGVPVKDQPSFDIDSYKVRMGLVGNSEYDQFLARFAQSKGKTPATLTPDEGMESFQKFAEMKQDPQMRAAALAQKNLADTLKKIQLDQMPTQADAKRLADDIVNHRIAPSQLSEIRGRGNGALGIMIEREMPKGFNWQEADSEYNLAKSPGFQQTVRYMDYVGSSINNVISAADKLANGKVRSLNAVKNFAANQLNGVDIARFNTDRLEVSDAIAKILQGGGTGAGTSDMKLKQAQELIKDTDDPQVVRTVAAEIQSLIGNRRQTLTKGTYMESAQPSGQKPMAQYKLGDSVMYNGAAHKITAIDPATGKLTLEGIK